MKQRAQVALDPAGVQDLLASQTKLQLATINSDGTPHLVTMFYALREERIVFWTYRSSQKARNLARDPRVTCLVEDGAHYFELRGVQVTGAVEAIEDVDGVAEVGRLVAGRMPLGPPGSPELEGTVLDDYVAQAARKRVAYLVRPSRVSSWDHGKLMAPPPVADP